jgi:hypothetical protein
MYSKDCLASDNNQQYTPLLPAARNGKVLRVKLLTLPNGDTTHVNNVAKSRGTSCIFLHIAHCTTQIKSSNICSIWFVCKKKKVCVVLWINTVSVPITTSWLHCKS